MQDLYTCISWQFDYGKIISDFLLSFSKKAMSCFQVIFNCHNQSEWYQPSLCYFNAFIALLIIPFNSLFGRGYACQIITLSLGYYKPVSEFPFVLLTYNLNCCYSILVFVDQKIVYKLNYWLTNLLTVALLW